MVNQVLSFKEKIIRIAYGVICFFIYFSGLNYLVSFLRRRRPLILMYHSVNHRGCPYVYPDNIVNVENFKRQMHYLSRKKRIISLSELVEYIESDIEFPPNVVVITFDDGYYDFYSKAYPILKNYKIPCTLFPITRLLTTGEAKWEDALAYLINITGAKSLTIRIEGVDREYNLFSQRWKLGCIRELNFLLLKMSDAERCNILSEIEHQLNLSSKAPERIMLSWKEILELQRDGIVSFGPHTHSHCNLAEVSPEMAELEISKSKEEMERFLGKQCILFSYPFGKKGNFNKEIKEMLRAKGFLSAVTTIPGRVSKKSDLFELKRIAAIDDASYKFKCSLIGITLQRS